VIGVWIGILAVVAAAVLVLGRSRQRSDSDRNLGSVSGQWIAEHRMTSGSDSRQ